jgi:fibro-slime domain-containing protein
LAAVRLGFGVTSMRTLGSIGLLAVLLAHGAGCSGKTIDATASSDAAAGQTGNGGAVVGNGGGAGAGGIVVGNGGGAGAGGIVASGGFAGSGGIAWTGGVGAAAGSAGTGGAAGTDASDAAGGGPIQATGGWAGFFLPDSGGGSGGQTYPDSAISPGIVFVLTEVGAYALGQEITGSGLPDTGVTVRDQACNVVAGVVRDFKDSKEAGGHPDFEAFTGDPETKGLVATTIGSDGKPVYTGSCEAAGVTATCPFGQQTTSKANFDQWYRYTDGVNKPFVIYLQFQPVANMMTFQSDNFFPLDGAGWGNNHTRGDGPRNFAFTTEVHAKFKYGGGETFTFIGDDDFWLFVNGKLAIDLGGVHLKLVGTLNLDQAASALGITRGNIYTLDLFHAERHTWDSHFRVDTNLAFTDCGTSIAPDIK